jgi:O-antigen/teichoic acid export membrane protein
VTSRPTARWKMIKIFKRKVFRHSAVYLVANLLSAAIPFVLLPVLTRHLAPAEYGKVAMFQTFLAALAAFTGLSVHAAAKRKYFDEGVTSTDMKDFISSCMQLLVVSTVIVLLIVAAFGRPLSDILSVDRSWLLVAVLVSGCGFIVQIRLGQWQVKQRPFPFGLLRTLQSLINAAASVWLVVWLMMGPEGRYFGITLSASLAAGIACYSLYREGLIGLVWRPKLLREAAAFGIPLIPHVCGIFLLSLVDRFIVNNELGVDQTGIYMVAVQLTMAMELVFDAMRSAFVPWLYGRLRSGDEKVKRSIVRGTYIFDATLVVIVVGAFLIGDHLVAFIAGESYESAGEIFWILVMGQAFNGMYQMTSVYIFYSKRTLAVSFITLSVGACNIVLLLILTERFGLVGAAAAFALSMALRFLLSWLVSSRVYPMPWISSMKATDLPCQG